MNLTKAKNSNIEDVNTLIGIEKPIYQYSNVDVPIIISNVVDTYYSGIIGQSSFIIYTGTKWFIVNGFLEGTGVMTGILIGTDATTYSFRRNAGADAVLKKWGSAGSISELILVASGSGDTTYSATGISGYQNLTTNNFLVQITSITSEGSYYRESGGESGVSSSWSGNVTLTYDSSSGIITITNASWYKLTHGSSGNAWAKTTGSISYKIYLIA